VEPGPVCNPLTGDLNSVDSSVNEAVPSRVIDSPRFLIFVARSRYSAGPEAPMKPRLDAGTL